MTEQQRLVAAFTRALVDLGERVLEEVRDAAGLAVDLPRTTERARVGRARRERTVSGVRKRRRRAARRLVERVRPQPPRSRRVEVRDEGAAARDDHGVAVEVSGADEFTALKRDRFAQIEAMARARQGGGTP